MVQAHTTPIARWRRAARTALAIASIAVGGAAGAFGRWGLAAVIDGQDVALLVANAVGCGVIGWATSALLAAQARPFAGTSRTSAIQGVTVGFCGAMTSFSTLAVTVAERLDDGNSTAAVGYLAITAASCAVMFGIGRFAWAQRSPHLSSSAVRDDDA